MSRIGNRIITVPANVNINQTKELLTFKGPLGQLDLKLAQNSGINIEIKDGNIKLTRANEIKQTKMLHGTYNALITNAITGVTVGFKKELRLIGVGYKATLKGNVLNLQLGYSHPIDIEIPKDLKVDVQKNTEITISGVDKEKVGEFAIQVRKWREPEPYKGKGVLYLDEQIIRKAGKTAEGKK
ncbi:50S ribosomal protein L6 [Mycoplasma sp. T363T]|uniref:Large ribosomal subunit protein uL6 n=1 Tax=Mycoplasma bradburyae TaxID=2963128 RepID=A0AAW6HNS4_9MOLU|nr:50S ribosomal protein L6 [Mycoplasma bradburyae]MDC4163280.1 50S ribosomal protein L6 [Mycoplasma bradburyae]MDC4181894.1 50S ribosomal protein L6 [Mycoplasma bradburyae]MDC4182593.1 50S ribosomal protein L6 [Mycoplasma bradburyae]MDC4183271.1 50S ribosomal protein L6 [Mycoplasma bradburyae]UTS70193.1 50S ribosomal protein L6 [Mycoplasma bradburyae]